uniref:Tyrosine--tRNA ligase n=1 Tax=Colletotrichum fructicola (strain Nara gc5) TaxID=1213859 RepID=L2FXS7_COLFN
MLSSLGPRLPELRRNICSRCARVPAVQLLQNQQRWITQKVLEKRKNAELDWENRAELIKKGEVPHIWDLFEERGFIKDVAGRTPQVKELLRTKRIGAYVGDPTGRLKTREVMANSEISVNITKIHYQMKKIWANVEALAQKHGIKLDKSANRALVNNNMWWQSLSLYEVMKRLGRYMRIGPMLTRDTVKNKMENGDGMSLAEFIYPMMQGWDFWHLYQKMGVQMQIGGSDQFGNIVAGIDAVKTIRDSEENPLFKMPGNWTDDPIGFTVPLLTDSSGAKFGKSAGNAVWLDGVEKLLRLFTFMPIESIQKTMAEHAEDPSKRIAQHTLAFEVVFLAHGASVAVREQNQHKFIHGKGQAPTGEVTEGKQVNLNNAPKMDMQLPHDLIYRQGIARILYAAGLASSVSEGHRIAKQGAAYVAAAPGQDMRGLVPGNLDWTPVKMWFPEDVPKFLIDGRVLILRKGKHNVRIIEVVTDLQWDESGKEYPGEPFKGKTRKTIQKLREIAERDGVRLSRKELNRMVAERLAEEETEIAVVNNPDIRFPTKSERQKVRDELMKAK